MGEGVKERLRESRRGRGHQGERKSVKERASKKGSGCEREGEGVKERESGSKRGRGRGGQRE